MQERPSRDVERTLGKPGIHEVWESAYRTDENERFYETVFDRLASILQPPRGARILDVGCGPAAHAIRLAKRGFDVEAVDFAQPALELARRNVEAAGMGDRVKVKQANLLQLPYGDGSFDYLLSWGVLMHVPDLDKGVTELIRVVRPGGKIVISESNMHSLEALAAHGLKRILRKKVGGVRVPSGTEYWRTTEEGPFVTRQTDIGWLIGRLEREGAFLQLRLAGQFSEAYAKLPSGRAQRLVHRVNSGWFRHVKTGKLALANIMIFEKRLMPPADSLD